MLSSAWLTYLNADEIKNAVGLYQGNRFKSIYSPIRKIKLKIREFEPKKHIMNHIGLGQNAVCTGR